MPAFVLDLRDDALDRAEGLSLRLPVTRAWLADALAGSDLRPGAASADAPAGTADDPGAAVGELDVTAHRVGQDIVVRGTAAARLVIDCSRCLEDASIDARTEVGALFAPRTGSSAAPGTGDGEVELSPEDIQRETYTGDRVVLDELVRELLILEVPMQPLCDDACAGIQPPQSSDGSGADDPASDVDPRLAPLLALQGKLPDRGQGGDG